MTIWLLYLAISNGALLSGVLPDLRVVWGGLAGVIVVTFHYQFIQGREFPDD